MRTYHLFIVACLGLINVACSSGTPPGSDVIATAYVTAIDKIEAMSTARPTAALILSNNPGRAGDWTVTSLARPLLKNTNGKIPSTGNANG